MMELPRAACMPPIAAEECERRGGTTKTDNPEPGLGGLHGHALSGKTGPHAQNVRFEKHACAPPYPWNQARVRASAPSNR